MTDTLNFSAWQQRDLAHVLNAMRGKDDGKGFLYQEVMTPNELGTLLWHHDKAQGYTPAEISANGATPHLSNFLPGFVPQGTPLTPAEIFEALEYRLQQQMTDQLFGGKTNANSASKQK